MSDPFSVLAGLGERLNRLSRRMTPGALGGRTDLASPRVAVAGMVPPTIEVSGHTHDGAGKPYATIVVAASDSWAPDAANADFVCAGWGDEVTIQAALDAAISGGFRGSVCLLEGEYWLNGPVTITGQKVFGQGYGTVIHGIDDLAPFGNILNITGGGSIVCDLLVYDDDGTHVGVYVGGPDSTVERVLATRAETCFYLNGDRILLRACIAEQAESVGISTSSGDTSSIEGCVVKSCTDQGIHLATGGGVRVIGNYIYNTNDGAGGGTGIQVDTERNLILGNYVHDNTGHGIFLDGAIDCAVHGNFLYDNGNTTHDHIHLVGADSNSIQGNKCRKLASATEARYGINVSDAASNDNVVTNNDLLLSAATGSLNNAGTGTITAAGNRL